MAVIRAFPACARGGVIVAAVLAIIIVSSGRAEGKFVEGVVRLSSLNTEQYIGKFSFSQGQPGVVTGNFNLADGKNHAYFDNTPHQVKICLFNDAAWQTYQALLKSGSLCRERVSLARKCELIAPNRGAADPFVAFYVDILAESVDHYWYAALTDCYLEEYDAHPPAVKYSVQFYNGHGPRRHLPADEDGLHSVHTAVFYLLVGFGAYTAYRVRGQFKSVGQVHLIVILLGGAYALQIMSVFCELAHLNAYERDGKGLRWRHTWLALDFLAGVYQQFSELIISFALIAIAHGWTLGAGVAGNDAHDEDENDKVHGSGGLLASFSAGVRKPSDLLRRPSVATVFFAGLFAVQVVLGHAGRTFEDDFNSYHDHEHWPGVVTMLLRLGLCALFVTAASATLAKARNSEVRGLMGRLKVLGAVWFAAFPVLVLLSAAFRPTRRHSIVSGGSLTLQTMALIAFTHMFLSPTASYFKLSTLSQMGDQCADDKTTMAAEAGFGAAAAALVGKRGKVATD